MRALAVAALLPALAAIAPPAGAQAGAGPMPPAYGVPAPGALPPRTPAVDPHGWVQATVDGADVLFVDDAPLPLAPAVPASGPLQRFASRPGAWYAAAFLPMSPQWPVQVWVWQRARTHEVRVTALDAAPWGTPSVAVPIPVRKAPVRGRAVLLTAPLALPAASRADGVFLLIEQWSLAGDWPGPVWLQARSRIVLEVDDTPWWSPRPDEASGPLAPAIPPSPLNAPRNASAVIELPIQQRAAPPASEVPR